MSENDLDQIRIDEIVEIINHIVQHHFEYYFDELSRLNYYHRSFWIKFLFWIHKRLKDQKEYAQIKMSQNS